jgi:hypothetical protein
MLETFERLGVMRRRYDLQAPHQPFWRQNLLPRANLVFGQGYKEPLPELTYKYEFTEYGIHFMRACRGPKQQQESESSSAS